MKNYSLIVDPKDITTKEYVDKSIKDSAILYVTFGIDPKTGILTMYYKDKYAGPNFRLNKGNLEVIIDA